MTENEMMLTISQTYARGKERLVEIGYKRILPPGSINSATISAKVNTSTLYFLGPGFLILPWLIQVLRSSGLS
jgi:hypothetical protein